MPILIQRVLIALLSLHIYVVAAKADVGLLRQAKPLLALARPLFDMHAGPARNQNPSLFNGTAKGSLFHNIPNPPAVIARPSTATGGTAPEQLRHLIGLAESRHKGYDAVQHGAVIKPPHAPTQMTIAQIYDWIKETPGQHHAIGRFQFIPATLRRLVKQLGIPQSARFSPQLQDQLADILLADAGYAAFKTGKMTRTTFMNNMARIWAGLPTSSGQSYYHNYAGNAASITWDQYETAMLRIFPNPAPGPQPQP